MLHFRLVRTPRDEKEEKSMTWPWYVLPNVLYHGRFYRHCGGGIYVSEDGHLLPPSIVKILLEWIFELELELAKPLPADTLRASRRGSEKAAATRAGLSLFYDTRLLNLGFVGENHFKHRTNERNDFAVFDY